MTILCFVAMCCALLPLAMFFGNARRFAKAPRIKESIETPTAISVLIPARNEARGIADTVRAVLTNQSVELEVVVLDDHSQDATAQIVAEIANGDSRLRLERAPQLPADWNGKQHACWVLSGLARHEVLCFLDADVRLSPDALRRAISFLNTSRADLVSGFPWQQTETFFERLLLPLIHFLLLGFLPIGRMRAMRSPSLGAGCGQLFLTRKSAYTAAGGHRAIRATRHDGLLLPMAYRRAGLSTDLFDAQDIACCQMYCSAREVLSGLAKNATEGLAAPSRIVPFTLLLGLGQVAPIALVLLCLCGRGGGYALAMSSAALAASFTARLAMAARFRQSWLGAALHPLGVAMLLAIQWYAWTAAALGRPVEWKNRRYHAAPAAANL